MRYSDLGNFIDGKASHPKVQRMERYSPVDGELLSTLPLSDAAELDKAVQAAKKAFADWSQWTIKERNDRRVTHLVISSGGAFR